MTMIISIAVSISISIPITYSDSPVIPSITVCSLLCIWAEFCTFWAPLHPLGSDLPVCILGSTQSMSHIDTIRIITTSTTTAISSA